MENFQASRSSTSPSTIRIQGCFPFSSYALNISGPFISENYQGQVSTVTDIKIASIFLGWQLGFTVLISADAGGLTAKVWRRTGRLTPYVIMVWVEIICNMIWGIICWMFLNEYIAPSFWFFITIVILWCFQLHCLIQIIVNRCSLLITARRTKRLLKWGCCAVVLFINISVFCIWIPAQLQISEKYVFINHIWDRVEKAIFLFLDAGLNFYFIYLVKTKLMNSGMTKYWPLFKFNICIVFVSLSFDVAIIALMSLQNGLLYAQFHPVAYMIKLSIEMTMAKLIGKIARSADGSTPDYSHEQHSTAGYVSDGKGGTQRRGRRGGTTSDADRERREKNRFESTVAASRIGDDDQGGDNGPGGLYHAWVSGPKHRGGVGKNGGGRRTSADVLGHEVGEAVELKEGVASGIITKDTTVTVRAESIAGPGTLEGGEQERERERDRASETSSTRELRPTRRPADAF